MIRVEYFRHLAYITFFTTGYVELLIANKHDCRLYPGSTTLLIDIAKIYGHRFTRLRRMSWIGASLENFMQFWTLSDFRKAA